MPRQQTPPRRCKDRVLSRREIESLIADQETIVIVDGKVLRLDSWLSYHPGGDKAIMHMVGRDATDEVNALHSAEARERMKHFQIGIIDPEKPWENFVPPIQGGVFPKEGHRRDRDEDHQAPLSLAAGGEKIVVVDEPTALPGTRVLPASEPGLESLDIRTQEEIAFDLAKYPSLDPEVQGRIVREYRRLHDRIKAEGLYDCNYGMYMIELTRYCVLFGLCLYFLRRGWYALSAVFLGLFWHQLVFTAHDAGHMGITHNYTIDTVIGIIVADFLGGLSLGWWKRSHNVHHIVTNSPEHDPDIEQMPFFAISHRFFASLRSTYYDRIMEYDPFSKFVVRYQAWLYYPILAFGRFNLYRLSWEYLLLGLGPRKGAAWWHRWFEVAGQIFFWAWFGYGMLYLSIPTVWDRVVFVLISHIVTTPLHVQITLSHYAMSTADLGVRESFPQKMLRTTMDVDCPPWLDFIHGGLQFQAIHHLYPRMPRHNLRRAQRLVQDFCADVGVPYALYGFIDGNKEVISHLGEIGRQATLLAECQRSLAEKSATSLLMEM